MEVITTLSAVIGAKDSQGEHPARKQEHGLNSTLLSMRSKGLWCWICTATAWGEIVASTLQHCIYPFFIIWRGGRVAEGTGLLNLQTR